MLFLLSIPLDPSRKTEIVGVKRMQFGFSELSVSFYNTTLSSTAAFERWGFHPAYTTWTKSKTKAWWNIITAVSKGEHPLTLSRGKKGIKKPSPNSRHRQIHGIKMPFPLFFFSLLKTPGQPRDCRTWFYSITLSKGNGTKTTTCFLS